MAEITKPHERIWLQTEAESTGEMTWCEDKINDDDVEYVRVDLFASLKVENEASKEMLNELLDCHYGAKTHHIGDGDGIHDEMAEKLRAYWEAHLAKGRK
jgi:hypothetical protein